MMKVRPVTFAASAMNARISASRTFSVVCAGACAASTSAITGAISNERYLMVIWAGAIVRERDSVVLPRSDGEGDGAAARDIRSDAIDILRAGHRTSADRGDDVPVAQTCLTEQPRRCLATGRPAR